MEGSFFGCIKVGSARVGREKFKVVIGSFSFCFCFVILYRIKGVDYSRRGLSEFFGRIF